MTEDKLKGLPVSGYRPQDPAKVALVNQAKAIEELAMRQCDALAERATALSDIDPRMVALARTQIQQGFMWLNRAVFQPGRIGDEAVVEYLAALEIGSPNDDVPGGGF